VEFEGEQLSYRGLNRRADELARRLRRAGADAESFVGVMLERSAELIVALLAVSKAGAAYVPINPNDPARRSRFILEDARVKTLVTTAKVARHIPLNELAVVCVDDETDDRTPAHEFTGAATGRAATAEGLAYLMYTSGSTGEPKGVMVTHRNVLSLVRGANYADLGAREVFLQFAPVSFDASTFEVWGPLLNGGRLVVFPPGTASLGELGEFVERTQVTTLWLTAGLFHQAVDAGLGGLGSVRQLLAGGEALSPDHVRRALVQLDGCRLINGYGPTETTTFACCHTIEPRDVATSVPIGRPVSNTQVYVLNSFEPAGVDERGELLVGGEHVARGYLGRPDLTAERFVPDPFSSRPGARLYRTGDLARHTDRGSLRFLGRADTQVKLNGFRIEPGEVEAALLAHSALNKALVIAAEVTPGNKRLVAYVVPAAGAAAPGAEELRRHLKERLPEYMVPSAYVALDELPLTLNGKVDRRALPAPALARQDDGRAYAAPRTAAEEVLAAVWEHVLGVERVGRDDDFFELGGHSLLATRVISRVREAFRVELPLRALFEAPTLGGLSGRVESLLRSGAGRDEDLPLAPRQRGEAAPLSFAQQRLWFLDQLTPGSNAYNIPVGFQLSGTLNALALGQALSEVVRRHEALRTNFVSVDGSPVQVVAESSPFALPVVDLSKLDAPAREEAVRRLAAEDARRPFDLTQDSLLRARLLRLEDDEHALLAVMHHIVSDGWSMEVLVREVRELYMAYTAGGPSPLAELPVQYADYADWQRERLEGEGLEAELAYWREQLRGAPAALDLPTDRPRPPALSLKGDAVRFDVPAETAERLRGLCREEGATLFMALLASFQLFLWRYTGQDDLVVGAPVAGRPRVETEGLIGFFVNTLALRGRLDPDTSLRESLSRARETVLGAQAHAELPFERLVEEVAPERTLSHGPLFQAMLVFQSAAHPASIEVGDLKLSPLGSSHQTEKFGLTLLVAEGARGLE
ncbi:MAG: amino acid adenylation domain-containing protein, partial [Pyrinomonadaceae bacterium]